MAVVLALCSALCYGLSDFLGGFLSRRTSAWSVAVVGQTSSFVCIAVLAGFVDGTPAPADLVWAVVAGVGGGRVPGSSTAGSPLAGWRWWPRSRPWVPRSSPCWPEG